MANKWVATSGQFIGSSGMAFVDQTAADVYFGNYFLTQGFNVRIAVICIGWGMSMLYLQRGIQGQQQWVPMDQHLPSVVVQDNGVYPALGLPNVPQTNQAILAGSPAMHNINNIVRPGKTLPWHRRITVTRVRRLPMHYHQHEERKDHTPFIVPPIRVDAEAAHWTFRALSFGTQVSNYRRVKRIGFLYLVKIL
ncbi:hypothetical protein C8Q79DRAFT_979892 [Trametes meyenii]|nr:hypothetical protein C8Q79DRAFT_979892 [Trametes meyenii]